MSIINRIFGRKENPTWTQLLVLYHNRQTGIWTPKDYAKLSEAGYQNCAVVFACVNQITRAARAMEWTLYKRSGKKRDEIEAHPLLDRLYRPNEYDNKQTFIENLIGFLLLAGNQYTLRVGVGNQPPVFLYVLRPDRMKVLPGDGKQLIRGYRYEVNGQKYDFEKGEVLHIKEFHPTNDFYGMSRLEAISRNIDVSNMAQEWNFHLMSNDMVPAGALSTTGALTPAQRTQLEQRLKEKYQGPENARVPLVLEGDLKWQQLSVSPKELDWLNSDKANSRKICSALGVAPELIGDSENKTYSNYQEARKALYIETVLPIMDLVCAAFNFWLTPLYGENLELGYDRDSIEALQEEREKKYAYLNTADWLKVNEKRAATGYDDVPDGDVILVSVAKVPLGATGLSEPDFSQEGKRKSRSVKTSFWQAPERKEALWSNFVMRVKAKERSLVVIADKYLRQQANRVRDALKGIQTILQAQSIGVDLQAEAEIYRKIADAWYREHFRRAGDAGISASKGELYDLETKGGVFETFPEHLEELKEMILHSGTEIAETTMQTIMDLLQKAETENWTVEQYTQEIWGKLQEFAPYRARRIARTESAKVENWGQVEGYKQTEFVEKKGWLCSFVPESREAHMAADTEYSDNPIPLEEPFRVGSDLLDYPGDPKGDPGNIINCLCTTFPVIKPLEE